MSECCTTKQKILVALGVAAAGVVAYKLLAPKKAKDPNTLVRETWAKITSQYTFQQIGDTFYGNLFSIDPELPKTAFKGVDQKKQAIKLVTMIDGAVKILDKPDTLVPVLYDCGKRHVHYHTKEEHFPVVGAALLKTLGQVLGNEWTPEVKDAWTGVYGVMTDVMVKGLRDAQKK